MNNYDQALNHWENHNKDKYYQQCGFETDNKNIPSMATIAEKTALSFYVGTREGQRLTNNFNNEDDAVEALKQLRKNNPNYQALDWMCIFTDKNLIIARE